MRFSELITQSVLARGLAIVFLFVLLLAAVAVAGYDLVIGHPLPQLVSTVLGGGIGYALTVAGVNYGVLLQPAQQPGEIK